MNLVNTKLRSSLQSETMVSLLTVKLNKQDFRTYDLTNAIIKWSSMDAVRRRRTEIQTEGRKKASETCDSENSDIDIVDDEPQYGLVIEGYTLSVNNCDTINEEFTDDGSVLGENTWDSSIAVNEGDL